MQSKLQKIVALTVMIAFISGLASSVVAIGNPGFTQANGVVDITTSQATISVTGGSNVPFYHIQLSNSNTSYLVKFQDLEEFVDKNGDGLFQSSELVPLSTTTFPGLNWNFSGFNTVNDSTGNVQLVNFNFTHNTAPMIDLNNHINVTNGNQIKFDINLSQYSWVSTNSSAKLAIKMQVAGGNLTSGANSNNITFGSAYFNTVSTATSTSGNIDVTTQIVNTNTFYIIFNHFNANVTLDPLFGVLSTSSTGSVSTSNSSTNNSIGQSATSSAPGFEALSILAGLAVVGIVINKKRNI